VRWAFRGICLKVIVLHNSRVTNLLLMLIIIDLLPSNKVLMFFCYHLTHNQCWSIDFLLCIHFFLLFVILCFQFWKNGWTGKVGGRQNWSTRFSGVCFTVCRKIMKLSFIQIVAVIYVRKNYFGNNFLLKLIIIKKS